MGAIVRRIEAEELTILVGGEHVRFRGSLAQVGVADPQLGVGADTGCWGSCPPADGSTRAPRASASCPGSRCRVRTGTCRVRVCRPAASSEPLPEQAPAAPRQQEHDDESKLRHACETGAGADCSHRYSACIPSSSETFGTNPRSFLREGRIGVGVTHVPLLRAFAGDLQRVSRDRSDDLAARRSSTRASRRRCCRRARRRRARRRRSWPRPRRPRT